MEWECIMSSSTDVFLDDIRDLINRGEVDVAIAEVRMEIDILTREIVDLRNAAWKRGNA
jgi:hypothetical protein